MRQQQYHRSKQLAKICIETKLWSKDKDKQRQVKTKLKQNWNKIKLKEKNSQPDADLYN